MQNDYKNPYEISNETFNIYRIIYLICGDLDNPKPNSKILPITNRSVCIFMELHKQFPPKF